MFLQNIIKKYGLWIIVLIALTLGIQTIHAPFFLDDAPQLEYVKSFSSVMDVFSADTFGFKRPAKNMIFLMVSHAGDHAVIAAHATSLALYITAIFVIFFWFKLWIGNSAFTVAGTALWAFSPTIVSSVVWLSCANIMLSMICILAGLICWEYAQRKQSPGDIKRSFTLWLLSIVAYILAFCAYEGAIIFPALVIIQDIIIMQRKLSRKSMLFYAGIGIIAILLLVIRGRPYLPSNFCIMGITDGRQLSFASAYFTLSHIWQWIWPFGSQEILGTFIWGKSAPLWILSEAWVLLTGFCIVSFIFFRRFPAIIAGLLWALISLVPMCNILPVRSGPFADYYLTLSSVGLSLATIFSIKYMLELLYHKNASTSRKRIIFLILFIITTTRLICVASTFNWGRAWRDTNILLNRSIHARPYAYHAKARLAHILLLSNNLNLAKQLALESLVDTEDFVLPRNVLGTIATKTGHFYKSTMWYKEVVDIDKKNMYAYLSLANLYNDHLNDKEQAEKYYRVVINNKQKSKYQKSAYINLSIIMGTAGKYEPTIILLKEALNRFPESKALKHNLKITYKNRQQSE